MGFLANSRFNPKPGILDFWNEFRKPNPYRWPILLASSIPIGILIFFLAGERNYKTPERPQITYITSFEPDRSDEEIAASNLANQEVKDLREAQREQLEQRKRDLYKALGAVAGMDVEEIDRRGQETRAAEAAERQAQQDALMGRTASGEETAANSDAPGDSNESSAP